MDSKIIVSHEFLIQFRDRLRRLSDLVMASKMRLEDSVLAEEFLVFADLSNGLQSVYGGIGSLIGDASAAIAALGALKNEMR